MADSQLITGSSEVVEKFGRWPSFHDAEIQTISIHRSEPVVKDSVWLKISLSFREYEPAGVGTAQYHQELTKACTLTLAFRNAKEIELEEFNHQNVIDDIDISQDQSWNRLNVLIQSIFGVGGSFSCSEVLIDSIQIQHLKTLKIE